MGWKAMVIRSPVFGFLLQTQADLDKKKIEEDFRRVPLPELGARAAQVE